MPNDPAFQPAPWWTEDDLAAARELWPRDEGNGTIGVRTASTAELHALAQSTIRVLECATWAELPAAITNYWRTKMRTPGTGQLVIRDWMPAAKRGELKATLELYPELRPPGAYAGWNL